MRPMYDSEVDVFRRQVQAFLALNLPSDWRGIGVLPADEAHAWVMDWRKILYRERYLAAGWPAEYGGGGMSALEQVILAEEFAKAGVPTGGPNDGFGITMLGNTLLTWGSDEQKKYYLPRILSNEDVWCQGYSEPGSGSDLASLRTRARGLLQDGWTVVVDAAFLRAAERRAFADLAQAEGCPFHILACEAPVDVLRQRISDRQAAGGDASEATLAVLEQQLGWLEPLTDAERASALTP